MAAASQLSLLPAHVPAQVVRIAAPVQAALFGPDELQPAAKPAVDEIANSDLEFHGPRASKEERAERLPVILRKLLVLEGSRSLTKQLLRLLEQKTGRRYVERTVRGWFDGREPEADAWEDLQLIFGRGLRAYVYYPESPEARAWWADVYQRAGGAR